MYHAISICASLILIIKNTLWYIFKKSRKSKKTNSNILKNITYLHAQNSQSHLGHYCYCWLASLWLATSQQATDNWGPQHLEDLDG